MALSSGQADLPLQSKTYAIQVIILLVQLIFMVVHGICFLIHLKKWELNAGLLILQNLRSLKTQLTRKLDVYIAETLPNPKLQVFPINEVSKIGKSHNVPLIVDNTKRLLTSQNLFNMVPMLLFILQQSILEDMEYQSEVC